MSAARTETGIVEWARPARAARTTELRLANVLADLIATAPTAAEKVALARAARRNGWYAELWDGVVPVFHDRDRELVAVRPWVDLEDGLGADPQAGVAAAVDVLHEQCRAWLAAATPVADCPTMRVLELILLDHARTGAPDQGFLVSHSPCGDA
jgi:hypothetical protein